MSPASSRTVDTYAEALAQALTYAATEQPLGRSRASSMPTPGRARELLAESVRHVPAGWPGEYAGIALTPGIALQAGPPAAALTGHGVAEVRVTRWGRAVKVWKVKP